MAPHAPAVARALLLAVIATQASAGVLYDQTDNCTNTYVTSEHIAATPFYDSLIADDFSVPAGTSWNIEQVTPQGGYFGGGQTAGSFIVVFYADAGGAPGAPIDGCSYPTASYIQDANTFNIALPAACTLDGGQQGAVYWFSVQANLYPSPTVDWTFRERSVQSGYGAHAEYPGGSDPDCAIWKIKQQCFGAPVGPDQCFSISGNETVFRNGFESL